MERTAFDRLVCEHLTVALRFATRLTGNKFTAEDLVHDAIVRAVNGRASLRDASRFRSWFFTIVINCFRDRLRQASLPMASPGAAVQEVAHGNRDATDRLADEETAQSVAKRVSNLPPRQREVLVLICYQELSTAEAAAVLGISEASVRTNLHFARDRLRRELSGLLDEFRKR